jgi:hypothetical protein
VSDHNSNAGASKIDARVASSASASAAKATACEGHSADFEAMAKLPRLDYPSPRDKLADRFHMCLESEPLRCAAWNASTAREVTQICSSAFLSRRGLAIAAMLAIAARTATSSATVRISGDNGGQIAAT